ncbi:MAG: helix-turn-helix domain-containing protein [Massiliimalia sp.]
MQIPEYLFETSTIHRSLTSDQANGILSCGFMFKPTSRFSQEHLTFPHYGAFLLLSGSGFYSDPQGRKAELSPGCFVQRMPGCPHTTGVTPDGKWLEFYICFGRDFYEAMADQGLLSREPVLFHSLTQPLLDNCISLQERFRVTPDSQLFSLFLAVQEFALAITQTAQKEQIGAWEGVLAKAAEILCTPTPDYPTPQKTAALVGMEYETFRKRFKTAFHCSPAAYQMQHRLNCSKQMLLDSQKTVQEIAWACRFSDGFAFSKAFRNHYGVSPSQFRKRYL